VRPALRRQRLAATGRGRVGADLNTGPPQGGRSFHPDAGDLAAGNGPHALSGSTDATHWRAEQTIRPAVVARRVCGANRAWAGAESRQILASVLRTTRQRDLNPHAVLASLVHARTPRVAAELN
jgi:hypothetical protein